MNKTIIKEIEKKEKAEILDIEIKSFSKNLKKDDLKIVDETIKLVEDQTNGLVKGATTDLQLVYNFSVKMKNLLPLNNMVKGTDIKQFGKIEKFTTAHVKKFTNVVLCYVMGKNPDTINSEDPYFYKVLRNIATSVIFQLKHDVIKHVENNAFNNPIGRKPKQIKISMSMVNQHEDLKKKFNSGGGAMDPTVVDIMGDLAGESNYRKMVALYEGEEQANKLRMGAEVSREEGDLAKEAGKIGVLGTALSGGTSLYSIYGSSR